MKAKLRMSPYRRAREELLSGRTATRIQAMADLEAAIRADQRRIDAEQPACGHEEPRPVGTSTATANEPGPSVGGTDPELTRDELEGLVDDLGRQAYRAEDVLAFIGEMCDAADADGGLVTTARVRSWLGYTGCGGALVLSDAEPLRTPATAEGESS